MGKHYINNKELYDEVVYCIENDVKTNKLYHLFNILATKCSEYYFKKNRDDVYDCAQTTLIKMIDSLHKYKYKEHKNAFSYFGTLAMNEAKNYLIRKQRNILFSDITNNLT